MNSKESLQRQIKEIEQKISETEKLLDALNDKKKGLECELSKLKQVETTNAFLQSIKNISDSSTMYIRLFDDTRTTPIMDEFYNSDYTFLVFERAFAISPCCISVSLVISKGRHGVKYKYNGLTMTDLKKAVGAFITESNLSNRSKDSRLYPLYEELAKISKKQLSRGEKIPFEIPCLLGGQTFRDQTGFGSEYCGEDLVVQGKEYGETTKFLIIGVIVEG